MKTHYISPDYIRLAEVRDIVAQEKHLALSPAAGAAIQKCRAYLDRKMEEENRLYYGINTGFGVLCDVRIDARNIANLQHNLVRSHACGMGREVPRYLVKLMLFLKIQSLSYGHSGVRLELVQRLVDFYNADALPVVYEQGSLGASGDLAPLAHLALTLLAEGEMNFRGERQSAAAVHEKLGYAPLALQSKEGLALLNGTQFSLAYLLWCTLRAEDISNWADHIAALSMDAFDASLGPLDERIHLNRNHPGQTETARHIREILQGSEISRQPKAHVQDPYSFRCVPQVHGASKATIGFVRQTVEQELNAVTDNPNIFPDSDAILSGGNFHAQPLALAADYLSIALSELGSISERRLYQLIGGMRNLPVFLTPSEAGLHSGFMIPQYTAASIVSRNKQLCTPASADSIVSCKGQEDHVSMAANAGVQCHEVTENTFSLLGIELMAAAQGVSFRHPSKTSPKLEGMLEAYRREIPALSEDRFLSPDMRKSANFIKTHRI